MKHINYITTLLLICTRLLGQSNEWKVVASKVTFKIKNAGIAVDGALSGLQAKIIFDPQSNSNSIEASLDAKTINTGNNLRDDHLRKTEYFDVTKFPKIRIKSNQIIKEKNGTYKGLFELTIKNKKKVIAIPFSFKENDGNALLIGTFSINRLDFEVGNSSFILSDLVIISIEIKATKN